jgi:hypothetical protein
MKKLLSFILCIAIIFSLTSCDYSEKKKQAALSTFESFEKSENFILLTCFELVIHGTRYDLDDIKYNGQKCNIVFLEEDGFYSYIYDQDTLSVEFLFTLYENFETTPLGTETVPSKIISASFADNRFLFWMDDTRTDEPKKMYYSWCIDTEQTEFWILALIIFPWTPTVRKDIPSHTNPNFSVGILILQIMKRALPRELTSRF